MVKIAVIGAGLMGIKIAGEMAYHGHHVRLHDQNEHTLNMAYSKLQEDREKLVQDSLLSSQNFIGNVICLNDLEDVVKTADFVVEAILEDMTVKQQLFATISKLCRSDTLLLSNTMRLDVNEVFTQTTTKDRTMGVRFLYPVYYIPEVEITQTTCTSPLAVEKVRTLLENMGKTLYFRRGLEPLVLNDGEREERKQLRQEQVKNASGLHCLFANRIPTLGQSRKSGSRDDDELGGVMPPRQDHTECAMCLDRPRDCVLCPCHHLITCLQCAKQLLNRRSACPICRKDITDVMRVYDS